MSGNRWDQPGVPHKGWHCVDVVDLRADGESADETDYATCQMCGNEKIRYVHMNKFKRWGYRIGSRFSTKTYATKDEAKLALFDDFWAATQDDDRLWASD